MKRPFKQDAREPHRVYPQAGLCGICGAPCTVREWCYGCKRNYCVRHPARQTNHTPNDHAREAPPG